MSKKGISKISTTIYMSKLLLKRLALNVRVFVRMCRNTTYVYKHKKPVYIPKETIVCIDWCIVYMYYGCNLLTKFTQNDFLKMNNYSAGRSTISEIYIKYISPFLNKPASQSSFKINLWYIYDTSKNLHEFCSARSILIK